MFAVCGGVRSSFSVRFSFSDVVLLLGCLWTCSPLVSYRSLSVSCSAEMESAGCDGLVGCNNGSVFGREEVLLRDEAGGEVDEGADGMVTTSFERGGVEQSNIGKMLVVVVLPLCFLMERARRYLIQSIFLIYSAFVSISVFFAFLNSVLFLFAH